jgi:hypothetical protein
MTKRVILSAVLMLAGLAGVALAQGEDPAWGEQRKAILLGDLKTELNFSDAQMASLDALCLGYKAEAIAKAQEIGEILAQIRDLSRDWQANFTAIVHLQFDLYVKEFELNELKRALADGVDGVLTAEQAGAKPLVMHVLDEAYRLTPRRPAPRTGQEGGDTD